MIIDDLPVLSSPVSTDEIAIERGTVTYKTPLGDLANGIGALPISGGTVTGAVARKIDKDFDTPPSSTEWTQVFPIVDSDNNYRGGVYLIRNTDGSYLVAQGVYKSGVGWNYIAPKINADGTLGYAVSSPKALKSAIGLGNVNNGMVLTGTTGAALYTQLNALPISPTNGAGVTCYINNAAMKLLTGNTALTTVLHGVITRSSTTRFKVFGMYGDTGYLMYWAFDITSAGAITPTTVYKLQGTAM